MGSFVEIKNISMNYHSPSITGETKAIEKVSVSITEGEFVSIIGPSGCGKSTLMSILCGLVAPSGGEVLIKGAPVADNRTQIGYMLQKDHLFEWRTIFQNTLLGLEIQNKLSAENIEYVESLLKKYGLAEFKNYKPSELSGGMRQRAALIRTLATRPEILLLDEPFSALDYQTRLFVADEIGAILRNEHKTVILVTHDISEAISLSDRIIVLSKRPAVVRNVHTIDISIDNKTPMKTRESPEFRKYFNKIWKELDVHV